MKWNRPTSLSSVVEAKATTRPLKIVYLVPFDESTSTHLVLDAVFAESYSRWGGAYTLIVPTSHDQFLADEYAEWLKRYDPDFIYSYVDLDASFVDTIDRIGCPIGFLQHKNYHQDGGEADRRSFLPHWGYYFRPVPSITTVHSPASFPQLRQEERPREPFILTQYRATTNNRFLADNFGAGFDVESMSHAVPGLFKTLCLVPSDLSPHMVAGTERCASVLEAFSAIVNRKATPIVRLAMANSVGMPRPEAAQWTGAFRIFIGDSLLDRVNFWNCRHLGDNWFDSANTLILNEAFFEDEELVKQLGQYLNKNNFLGRGNGSYQVELHSSGASPDALSVIRDKLRSHTWNDVGVSSSLNALATPSKGDLNRIFNAPAEADTLKLTEDVTEIRAVEPDHYMYIPPQLRGIARGQWVVDLSIQRHNNLSRYSNVVDAWTLPKRRKIVRAFTDQLAKPTSTGRLALLPTSSDFPFTHGSTNKPSYFEIRLPSDEVFFRHLALDFFRYPEDDLRAKLPKSGYVDLAISDKGQNLRGVISLFDHLSTAFEILTNKFWRTVFETANEEISKPRTFSMDKLQSFLPNDQKALELLTKAENFSDIGITKAYMRDSLMDTLEHLVRSRVFYQIAQWRCRYCGHANSRSFDNMRIRNECEICATEFLAPIDIVWKYELNEFVYSSLQKHSGLPVLWTLGFLQDRPMVEDFWYLPEVDLFDGDADDRKNEIDLLCMLKGEFYAIEVKRSASLALNKAGFIDKFVSMMSRLRPDVAVLSFQQYCMADADVEATKHGLAAAAADIRTKLAPWTRLEIMVAQDIEEFRYFSADIGWSGPRVRRHS